MDRQQQSPSWYWKSRQVQVGRPAHRREDLIYFNVPDAERVLDLVGLPNCQVYLKLMTDGKVSRPFSAEAIMT